MNEHILLLLKSIFTYFILVALTRFMGRKQISSLTFFDYVAGITIGSIAGEIVINKDIDFLDGLVSLTAWSILTILTSIITLKNIKLRLLVDSEPLIIIHKGKVIYKNMKRAKYNMGDLLMQLRDKDIFNITDVETALLEPDGKLSVLKKPEQNIATLKDLNIKAPKVGLMADLILDGKILTSHLSMINKDETWLYNELNLRKLNNINKIVYAGMQADEQLYIVTKD